MKETLKYTTSFTKADAMELYAKAITNLGPLNAVNEKLFNYDGDKGEGMGGFVLMGYSMVPDAYVAVQLMISKEPRRCKMERRSLGTRRSITLMNPANGGLEVTIEGSAKGNARVKKLCDALFNVDATAIAQAKAIAAYLRDDATNT